MRILYLHQYYTTPCMSGGTRSYEMARRLVAAGHVVHMITSDYNSPKSGSWRVRNDAGIVVHSLQLPYSNYMRYLYRIQIFFRFALRAAIYAARIPADVVFASSTPLTIALPALCVARRQNIPMVFEVRDLWPDLPIAMGAIKGQFSIFAAQWLERFAYAKATKIIALSPGISETVAKRCSSVKKIHFVPNGSDLELFNIPLGNKVRFREKYDWLKDRPLVIYAGSIGRINGVSYLVRLAALLKTRAPEVRFLVVGDGYEREEVCCLAMQLNVLDWNLYVIKSIPKSEIATVFAAADIATSLFIDLEEMWTNSANKFFDALAAGTPVAINYKGWQADLLEQSGAGIILDPQDIDKAASVLLNFLEDKNRLIAAGSAARRLAEKHFSRDELAKQLEEILLSVVPEEAR